MELLFFQLVVLIFSVIIHEVSHGYVAEYLGDPTARLAGRLTFNPLKHLDPFGSFILPLLLYFSSGGAVVFGWAKPVPYNSYNLKNPAAAGGKIAAAGPVSNLLIAAVFGTLIRTFAAAGLLSDFLATLFGIIIYLNILLSIFNLVPIPPLDGSRVLFALMPKNDSTLRAFVWLERYGMILVFLFILFGFQLIIPLVHYLFSFFAGSSAIF